MSAARSVLLMMAVAQMGCWDIIEGGDLRQGTSTQTTSIPATSGPTTSSETTPCTPHVWSKSVGTWSNQSITALAIDPEDNILLAGFFSGTIDFGDGVEVTSGDAGDAFVMKLDPQGELIWGKNFGEWSDQYALGVAADSSGNLLVAGAFYNTIDLGGGTLTSMGDKDMFLVKLDPDGEHIWSKRFGGAGTIWPAELVLDASGGPVVAGEVTMDVDFGGGTLTAVGDADAFVARWDSDGNHVFSALYGDADKQIAESVAVDGDGNVLLTGQFYGSIDFTGGAEGGTFVSAGDEDGFLAKLGPTGDHLWSKSVGDGQKQDIVLAGFDGSGDALVFGMFAGTANLGGELLLTAGGTDLFVAKLDPDGNHVWSERYGGVDDERSMAFRVDPAGNLLLTGDFQSTFTFGGELLEPKASNAYFAILSPSGEHLFSAGYGGDLDQLGTGIAVDGAGDVVIAGNFLSTIDLGGGELSSAGSVDMFVAKLAGCTIAADDP